MNIENLLRETLADMADEQAPPPPARFLPQHPARFLPQRPARRRGATLAAAAAVVVLAAGGTVAVRVLAPEAGRPEPSAAARPGPGRAQVEVVNDGERISGLFDDLARVTGRPAESFAKAAGDGRALGLPPYAKGGLEGFAFPGTYRFAGSAAPDEILRGMVARFRETADELGLAARSDALDVVIVASLVQAESPTEADMPKVARVLLNRLARGMMLQVDSSVRYALGRRRGPVTVEDVKVRSPYNTYRHKGLPPGPVANPGEAALRAALDPAAGSWLYFVLTDPKRGTLGFATTGKEYAELTERARQPGYRG
ncbi:MULTISPECIES: endolytic transglycosylase MltG [unclassified Nonomuraea]|uniref:endolytic transglycosylase MltG n=1 Tax=unclassified Nonomuraea TaxID=2593643 RepID=UPI0033E27ABA